MDQSQHFISNILMTIRGNTADVESYFYGFHRINGPNGEFDAIGAGRYVDRLEKRGEEWRILGTAGGDGLVPSVSGFGRLVERHVGSW